VSQSFFHQGTILTLFSEGYINNNRKRKSQSFFHQGTILTFGLEDENLVFEDIYVAILFSSRNNSDNLVFEDIYEVLKHLSQSFFHQGTILTLALLKTILSPI